MPHFGKNIVLVTYCIMGYMMLVCLIIGDIDPDYLVKVVSAGFLLCNVIFFPLYNY